MPSRSAPSDIRNLLTDEAIARWQAYRHWQETAPHDPTYEITERELIEYRSAVYRSIARRLGQVRTKRDLLSIARALELGALL